MSELIQIEKLNAVDIFRAGGIDGILKAIEKEVIDFIPDVTTDKGRKEIASRAYKVAQSKTAIDAAGKKLADELNAQLSPINGERKKARDFLDSLKDKVREPLTRFEEAEAERRKEILSRIQRIRELPECDDLDTLVNLVSPSLSRLFFQEFYDEAEKAVNESMLLISAKIEKLTKQKEEREELERLRKEEEERKQKEREEAIRQEAYQRAEREKKEAIAKIEKERAEAIEQSKKAAEKAERDKQAAIIAERERIQKIERERIEAEKKQALEKEKAELIKSQDVEHRRKVNRQALEDLKKIGVDQKQAMIIIKAIASQNIKNISINY